MIYIISYILISTSNYLNITANEPTMLEGLLNNLDFILGLMIGLIGTAYSLYQRKIELKAKLYYPLFIACYNLIYIFDEIESIKDNEEQGRELYNSASNHLDDIMNSFGTAVNLKTNSSNSEKNYLNIFFKVKRIVDLSQDSINKNWSKSTIWFESARNKIYNGKDPIMLNKIEEFEKLYNNLLSLKNLCEQKEKSLKGQNL